MIDSRAQHFGAAMAASLDVHLRLLPWPEIHRHTAAPFHA
jgi:hypothetical protein